eukprot:gene12546-biopygen14027
MGGPWGCRAPGAGVVDVKLGFFLPTPRIPVRAQSRTRALGRTFPLSVPTPPPVLERTTTCRKTTHLDVISVLPAAVQWKVPNKTIVFKSQEPIAVLTYQTFDCMAVVVICSICLDCWQNTVFFAHKTSRQGRRTLWGEIWDNDIIVASQAPQTGTKTVEKQWTHNGHTDKSRRRRRRSESKWPGNLKPMSGRNGHARVRSASASFFVLATQRRCPGLRARGRAVARGENVTPAASGVARALRSGGWGHFAERQPAEVRGLSERRLERGALMLCKNPRPRSKLFTSQYVIRRRTTFPTVLFRTSCCACCVTA